MSAPGGDVSRNLTPALRQYFEAKEVFPDSFLFFQVGDFFELFFDDALQVAPLLDLTLTSRQKIDNVPVPMCGVPLAAGESYINRLAAMGYKVSVCEQDTLAAPGEKVAKRVVKRVVTPGTILESDDESGRGRYLALILPNPEPPARDRAKGPAKPKGSGVPAPSDADGAAPLYFLALLDLSTGDFLLASHSALEGLATDLLTFEPQEILLTQDAPEALQALARQTRVFTSFLNPSALEDPQGAIRETFGEDFRLDGADPAPSGALLAAGAALRHLKSISGDASLAHLAPPRLLWESPRLFLDEAAIRNLELVRSLRDGGTQGTLFGLLNRCFTPMGGRTLKDWLLNPSRDRTLIELRRGAVAELLSQSVERENLGALLKNLKDLEKALSRLTLGRGSIKDLFALRAALGTLPAFREILSRFQPQGLLAHIGQNLNGDDALYRALQDSLEDELPPGAPEGAAARSELSPKLAEYRDLESSGKRSLAAIETQERERTGISSLKIRYNRVFGYFLEVTKSQLAKIPPDWTRKQTLAGAERFVTPAIREFEEKILAAATLKGELEERILWTLKKKVAAKAPSLKALSTRLGELDALASLALVAQKYAWTSPEIASDDLIDIKGGRHPMVEAFLPPGEAFVANDVRLTPKERLLIITGPNMAGKSTILRQVALIVILNQMGSFVPASHARLSLRDAVFTRVGASDDLSRGRSTFMVEMSETARVLTRATPRSLVILDEVGRGTSTFDGLAIAWAVAEWLHDLKGRGVPTLFATHYHELVDLAKSKPLTVNYNVSVKKWEGKVVFLRKLVPGGTSHSYGLAVASLAGLPRPVVQRAAEVLADLTRGAKKTVRPQIRPHSLFQAEEGDEDLSPAAEASPTLPLPLPAPEAPSPREQYLADAQARLVADLGGLPADKLTPLEALNLLFDLKARAQELLP